MENTVIFVYGTLKRDYWNNYYIEDSIFRGEAISVGKYDMYGRTIPEVVINENGNVISGEIYEIDEETLRRVDRLENNGYMYTRQEEQFILNGETVTAWIYLSNTNREYLANGPRFEPVEGVLIY